MPPGKKPKAAEDREHWDLRGIPAVLHLGKKHGIVEGVYTEDARTTHRRDHRENPEVHR